MLQNILAGTAKHIVEKKREAHAIDIKSDKAILTWMRNDVTLFKSLDDDNLMQVCFRSTLEYFLKGELIINQGEQGSKVYVIRTGEVDVSQHVEKHGLDLTVALGTLKKNAYFGEVALFKDDALRTANVFAAEDTTCVVIERDTFWNVINKPEPELHNSEK